VEIGRSAYRQSDIYLPNFAQGMSGPILILYALLALYALEIVVPLLVVAVAMVRRRLIVPR